MSSSGVALLERASSVPAPRTRNELIELIAARLERKPSMCFRGIYDIELYDRTPEGDAEIRALSTADTAFEPVREALNKAGVPTDETVGAIMDGLQIDRDELHALICNCNGETITGAVMATRLRSLTN